MPYCVPLDQHERRNKLESSVAKALSLTSSGRPRTGKMAFIARSMMFQHLIWRDSSRFVACPSPHYYTPRMGVTRSEFTLAPAYKACLLVRHSGGPRHLIMAIARGTHGSPQRLLVAHMRLLAARTGSPQVWKSPKSKSILP